MAAHASELELVSGDKQARAANPLKQLYLVHENAILGTLGVALFLGIWEWAGQTMPQGKLFFSAPTLVIKAFLALAPTPTFWNDVWVSFQEFGIGYVLSIVVGIPLGIAMGWYRRVNALLDPLASAFYAMPRVALIPLLLIWFGIGMNSKIALVFLSAVFQILITTLAGVRTMDESLIRAARSFGANDRQMFVTVVLPGSVPFILTGLKLAVGRALIGVVVAEFVAAQAGIGYMMAKSGATFQTDQVMVGVVIITFAGMASLEFLRRLELRFETWRPQRDER